ncbi:hypothetical protein EVAR_85639_1 [Eumeta japonica]|uniref:Uncharacterized protein n=1 Tax=Eumeta variegata TaxID=151549 RepID=A0A4C1XU23_EUMVA|nr:hypothetical protein EVAR_85639_1 [Eumeta japonica]
MTSTYLLDKVTEGEPSNALAASLFTLGGRAFSEMTSDSEGVVSPASRPKLRLKKVESMAGTSRFVDVAGSRQRLKQAPHIDVAVAAAFLGGQSLTNIFKSLRIIYYPNM